MKILLRAYNSLIQYMRSWVLLSGYSNTVLYLLASFCWLTGLSRLSVEDYQYPWVVAPLNKHNIILYIIPYMGNHSQHKLPSSAYFVRKHLISKNNILPIITIPGSYIAFICIKTYLWVPVIDKIVMGLHSHSIQLTINNWKTTEKWQHAEKLKLIYCHVNIFCSCDGIENRYIVIHYLQI